MRDLDHTSGHEENRDAIVSSGTAPKRVSREDAPGIGGRRLGDVELRHGRGLHMQKSISETGSDRGL